jgi:hypothetical protein
MRSAGASPPLGAGRRPKLDIRAVAVHLPRLALITEQDLEDLPQPRACLAGGNWGGYLHTPRQVAVLQSAEPMKKSPSSGSSLPAAK